MIYNKEYDKVFVSYDEYLLSSIWKEKRKIYITENSKCEKCKSTENLHLHHKNYKNIGNETSDDFIVLCKKCHFKLHQKRERKTKTKDTISIKDRNFNKKFQLILEYKKVYGSRCKCCGVTASNFVFYNSNLTKIYPICDLCLMKLNEFRDKFYDFIPYDYIIKLMNKNIKTKNYTYFKN